MNNNTFKHTDFSGDFISLHNCTIDKISYNDGVLSFLFCDGFWVKPTHHANSTEKNLRTSEAKVDFTASTDNTKIAIYRRGLFGNTVKKDLTTDALCDLVNNKNTSLEIIGTYPSEGATLIKCWARDKKSDKVSECHIELTPTKIIYHW